MMADIVHLTRARPQDDEARVDQIGLALSLNATLHGHKREDILAALGVVIGELYLAGSRGSIFVALEDVQEAAERYHAEVTEAAKRGAAPC